MNIMNQLTKKHMIVNKKRTIMTILGVIVSVAMITAVSIGTNSFLDLLQRMEINDSGYWHEQFSELPASKLAILEQDSNSKSVIVTKDQGYANIDGVTIENEYKPYLYIKSFSKDAMSGMSLKLKEGRFPENKNEILLSEHLSSNGNVTYNIGDRITLNLGDRYIKNARDAGALTQNNPYILGEEEFETTSSQMYTVVGIIGRPKFEEYNAPGYTVITYLNVDELLPSDTVTAHVFLESVTKKVYDEGSQMATRLGLSENNVNYNNSLLRYYGISRYDNFNLMMSGLAMILIVIIMVGSISLIYNSFAISISERSKQFGMLSSVGATKKQKRNAVLYEGAVIGVIAIPLGILSGIVGMWVTFGVVGDMLVNAFDLDTTLRLCISVKVIVSTVFFSIITIYISAFVPAKRASRITPIEAIRQSKDVIIKTKVVKTNPWIRRFLGLEGELALKNLKRNKKRFKALVFSLFISFVLFTGVSSYVYYLSGAMNMYMEDLNYDMYVSLPSQGNQDTLSILESVEGIERGEKISYMNGVWFTLEEDQQKELIKKDYLEQVEENYRNWGYSEEDIKEIVYENLQLIVSFIILEDGAYQSYLKQIDVQELNLKNQIQGVFINTQKDVIQDSVNKINVLNVHAKDVLYLEVESSDGLEDVAVDGAKEEVEKHFIPMHITAVSEQLPMGAQYSGINGNVKFIISESSMRQIISKIDNDNIYLDSTYYFILNQPEGIEKRLDTVIQEDLGIKNNYRIYNRYAEAEKNHQFMMVISIFAYGFITLISLICMANLCNTISTSFALRRREFAMLKSVGMTPKSFERMIRYESMLYGIKALLYGIPVGVALTLWIYNVVAGNFSGGFSFPIMSYVIGILAIFVVVGVAMIYSSYKLKKDTIIDALKSEII